MGRTQPEVLDFICPLRDCPLSWCIFPESSDIELKNVTFHYNKETSVLKNCSLKIAQGEKAALIGRSRAGKSTVIQLIARSYDVKIGNVLIGGVDVRKIAYHTLLQNIAIVFQKTFLTDDSVLENIRMGSNATLDDVGAAQIDDFIMSLPDGYDTEIGSFGSQFSGGEKQRIAIVRAYVDSRCQLGRYSDCPCPSS